MRPPWEFSHLQARKRALTRSDRSGPCILDFWPPELWENKFLLLKLAHGILFWQPALTNTGAVNIYHFYIFVTLSLLNTGSMPFTSTPSELLCQSALENVKGPHFNPYSLVLPSRLHSINFQPFLISSSLKKNNSFARLAWINGWVLTYEWFWVRAHDWVMDLIPRGV